METDESDTSSIMVVDSDSEPTPPFCDSSSLISYIQRVTSGIFDESLHLSTSTSATSSLISVLNERSDVIQKFIGDPMSKSLFVQKISNKDEGREDEYVVNLGVVFTSVRAIGVIFIKRENHIEMNKSFGSQIQLFVLNEGSPYETLHTYISSGVVPFFKSYLQEKGSFSAESRSDKLAPLVEKKLAELELGLLHLKQNIDTPEISLAINRIVPIKVKVPKLATSAVRSPKIQGKSKLVSKVKEQERLEKERQKEQERLEKEMQKEVERVKKEEERMKKEEERKKKEEVKEQERLKREEEQAKKNEEKRKREEERLKKEEEKRKQQEEKDKEKQKVEQKVTMQKNFMTNFFQKSPATATVKSLYAERRTPESSGDAGSDKENSNDLPAKDCIRTEVMEQIDDQADIQIVLVKSLEVAKFSPFPFQVKSNMALAPLLRRTALSDSEKKYLETVILDTVDEPMADESKEGGPVNNCLSDLIQRGKRKELRKSQRTVIKKETDRDIQCLEDFRPSEGYVKYRIKLLQFHENRRPAYWGTWKRKSTNVKPGHPWAKDQDIDYDFDSDDEWEDEPEDAEEIENSEGEEEVEDPTEGEPVDEDDEEGWMVPHGYLWDNEREGDEMDLDVIKSKEKEFFKSLKEQVKMGIPVIQTEKLSDFKMIFPPGISKKIPVGVSQ